MSEERHDRAGYAYEVADDVVAAVAAHAAAGTPGVVRMAPGVEGLVGEFGRRTRQRVGLAGGPPTEGVEVDRVDGGAVTLRLDIVTDGRDNAAAVATTAQRAVAREVVGNTGVEVASVGITILDIDLGGGETG
jgi:uncharacterized alkaline shock family protein YloU